MCTLLACAACADEPAESERTDQPAAVVSDDAGPAPARASAEAEAARIIETAGPAPASPEVRARLLELFDVVYGSRLTEGEALPQIGSADLLLSVRALAMEGDPDFLAGLMGASDGWYGRTVEGSEWLNEMLWEVLEVQPGLTLSVLAGLTVAERSRLIENEYLRPVHDGFDFRAIAGGLRSAEAPPGLEADVGRILAVVEELAN